MRMPIKVDVFCKNCGRVFTLVWVGEGKPIDKGIASARKDYKCDACFLAVLNSCAARSTSA